MSQLGDDQYGPQAYEGAQSHPTDVYLHLGRPDACVAVVATTASSTPRVSEGAYVPEPLETVGTVFRLQVLLSGIVGFRGNEVGFVVAQVARLEASAGKGNDLV